MQIYHNPRCSKSRQTLELIERAGIDVDIVLYLENPPSASELQVLLQKLGIGPRELLRKQEAAYKELGLADQSLSDAEIMQAMISHPKLIERPIVVSGKRAVIGRPPENVKQLF